MESEIAERLETLVALSGEDGFRRRQRECVTRLTADVLEELTDRANGPHGYSGESRSRSGGTDGKGTWGGESVFHRRMEQLPQPDLPLTVELDGGFVHSKPREGRTYLQQIPYRNPSRGSCVGACFSRAPNASSAKFWQF